MEVFELFFNPPSKKEDKLKSEKIFDSFCYEPTNPYEEKLGNLYIVGQLSHPLPKNLRFLEKISEFIKEKYYSNYFKDPETALKEALKELNSFFEEELKRDHTQWMGNLDLAILSLSPHQKEIELNFTKIGKLKILLLKEDGQIIDIGSKLEHQEIEPYPLRVFSNILSGKIPQKDTLGIFTKEVFDNFQNENLILNLAKQGKLTEKKIKKVLKPVESKLKKISGLALLINLENKFQTHSVLNVKESFSFLKMVLSKISFLKGLILKPFSILFSKINYFFSNFFKERVFSKTIPFLSKRNLILILAFVSILVVGRFLIFLQGKNEKVFLKGEIQESLFEKNQNLKDFSEILEFKSKDCSPTNFLKIGNSFYFYSHFCEKTYKFDLKDQKLNTLKKPPKIISLLKKKEFLDVAIFGGNFYFLEKEGQIIKYLPQKEKEIKWLNPFTKKPKGVKSIAVDGSIWVLTKDNKIENYYLGKFKKGFSLKNENFSQIFTSFFLKNLYLLNPSQNKIVILTKKGEFSREIKNQKFDNLLDIFVSNDEKTIWVLNGKKLYKFSI